MLSRPIFSTLSLHCNGMPARSDRGCGLSPTSSHDGVRKQPGAPAAAAELLARLCKFWRSCSSSCRLCAALGGGAIAMGTA